MLKLGCVGCTTMPHPSPYKHAAPQALCVASVMAVRQLKTSQSMSRGSYAIPPLPNLAVDEGMNKIWMCNTDLQSLLYYFPLTHTI